MKIFKNSLFKTQVLLVIFFSRMALAAPCDVEAVADPHVQGRALSVTMPNGATIFVVGYAHGDREFPGQIIDLLKDAKEGLSNADFSSRLHQLLVDNDEPVVGMGLSDTTVEMAHKNLDFLRQLLTEDKYAIRFVGEEATPEISRLFQKQTSDVAAAFADEIRKRALPPSQDFTDAMLVMGGAQNYLRLTEPDLFQNRSIVGFESTESEDNEERMRESFEKAQLRLKAVSNPQQFEYVKDKRDRIYGVLLYGPYDPNVYDERVLSDLSLSLPRENQDLEMEMFKALLNYMKATVERDENAAKAMVATGKSEILFVGDLHLKSIARYVHSICQSEPATQ